MHVSSYPDGSQRILRRLARAAAVIAMFASVAGAAHAVEFDEKVKAPMVKDPAAFRSQAQSFSARYAALQAADPLATVTDRSLFSERFQVTWQLQQAIDTHRPLGDLAAVGFVSRGDGAYDIDYNAFPQWQRLDELFARLLPQYPWESYSAVLVSRGFRPADVEILENYIASHDASKAAQRDLLALAVSFSKLVKKYDKIKRPVPDALVLAYLYQRASLDAEATRAWTAGLLGNLDAQRGRILVALFSEMTSTGILAPSDQQAGIAEQLRILRLPNFEQLATAAANGGTP
jgi:hypothetical protein